jgi:hypothetical protein
LPFLAVSYINFTFWQADRSACYLLFPGFLLILFFNAEDGGVMFLQNAG